MPFLGPSGGAGPTCKNKFILMWASSFPGPLAHVGKFNFDPVFPSLHKLPIEYNFLAVFDHGMVLILKFSRGSNDLLLVVSELR